MAEGQSVGLTIQRSSDLILLKVTFKIVAREF